MDFLAEMECSVGINKSFIHNFVCSYKSRSWSQIPKEGAKLLYDHIFSVSDVMVSVSEKNPLSVVETVIVVLSILGRDSTEIANILYLSPNTIKSHMSRIKIKMNATTKIRAILNSIIYGVVEVYKH